MGYQGRDVEVVLINSGQYLVASCDSCGAVGLKQLDVVKASPDIVGRLTARVALLEIVSTGSQPQLLTVAIACEPEPTGAEILKGIRDELASFGMAALPLAVSTEKNFPTRQTGLGVSVVGLCDRRALRIATTKPGDLLYCLGLPKVGAELSGPDDPQIVQGRHIQKLFQHPEVHDIIPVGSQGIAAEANLLASSVGGHWNPNPQGGLNLTKSAGPATCLIFSAASPCHDPLFVSIPCHFIGAIE